jgi:hypothetical protein
MPFEVKWLKEQTVVAFRNFSTLEEAARDAEQLLPVYQKILDATAVEVWDRRGFRHFLKEADKAQ